MYVVEKFSGCSYELLANRSAGGGVVGKRRETGADLLKTGGYTQTVPGSERERETETGRKNDLHIQVIKFFPANFKSTSTNTSRNG
ncbi:hypothetical protein SRHO_G00033540 [Serrasalmus rhombeus]